MEYPNATVTIAGANLLAQTNGNGNDALIIDKAIASNKLSSSSTPLDQTTVDEFTNPITTSITTVKHQGNTLQPEVTFHNDNLNEDYPIYMVGLLAHAKSDNSGNEILFGIAEANDDPMILPHKTDNEFDLDLAIPIGISNNSNVQIVTTEAGTLTTKEFNNYKSKLNQELIPYKGDLLSSDLNAAYAVGIYIIKGANLQHAPSGAAEPFWGNIQITPSPSGVRQILYDNNDNNAIFSRVIGEGNKGEFINPWIRLSNDGDLTNINSSIKDSFNQSTAYTDTKTQQLLSNMQSYIYSGEIYNSDLNECTSFGYYSIKGRNIQHAPSNVNFLNFYGNLRNMSASSGAIRQFLYDNNNNSAIFTRIIQPGFGYNKWSQLTD